MKALSAVPGLRAALLEEWSHKHDVEPNELREERKRLQQWQSGDGSLLKLRGKKRPIDKA